MQIVEKSRRKEYSAWYGKELDRVVYFIDGHFLHHQHEGDISEYDKNRNERAMQEKSSRYEQTGGQWIDAEPTAYENQFSWRIKNGPIEFIKEVRKCGQTFDERMTTITYCENGKCWMFSGNLVEVSNAFYFIIYTKELADEIRAMVPEVKYHDDGEVIL